MNHMTQHRLDHRDYFEAECIYQLVNSCKMCQLISNFRHLVIIPQSNCNQQLIIVKLIKLLYQSTDTGLIVKI